MSQLGKASSAASHLQSLQNQALAVAIRAGLERLAERRCAATTDSTDHVDLSAVPGSIPKRSVAGDDWRLDRFGEGDVHGVVCTDVLSQLPRTTQEIQVGVTVEIEIRQIRDRVVGTPGGDFTRPHETSKALYHLDVDEVRCMELVPVAKEAGFDADAYEVCRRTPIGPTRRRRSRRLALRTDHDGGWCFQRHSLSAVEPGQHVLACWPRRQTLEFGQEVVGQCSS
jgi:hypothetical protein